jgi:hypothetical protein
MGMLMALNSMIGPRIRLVANSVKLLNICKKIIQRMMTMKFSLIERKTGKITMPDQNGMLYLGNGKVFISGDGKPYQISFGYDSAYEDISETHVIVPVTNQVPTIAEEIVRQKGMPIKRDLQEEEQAKKFNGIKFTPEAEGLIQTNNFFAEAQKGIDAKAVDDLNKKTEKMFREKWGLS